MRVLFPVALKEAKAGDLVEDFEKLFKIYHWRVLKESDVKENIIKDLVIKDLPDENQDLVKSQYRFCFEKDDGSIQGIVCLRDQNHYVIRFIGKSVNLLKKTSKEIIFMLYEYDQKNENLFNFDFTTGISILSRQTNEILWTGKMVLGKKEAWNQARSEEKMQVSIQNYSIIIFFVSFFVSIPFLKLINDASFLTSKSGIIYSWFIDFCARLATTALFALILAINTISVRAQSILQNEMIFWEPSQ
jgi:hypothetical protein